MNNLGNLEDCQIKIILDDRWAPEKPEVGYRLVNPILGKEVSIEPYNAHNLMLGGVPYIVALKDPNIEGHLFEAQPVALL
jgi:hypothetical protein